MFPGTRLEINVESLRSGGQVEVVLLNHAGNAIAGCDFDTAIGTKENRVCAPVRWQGEPRIDSLKGE